jgi:hypothetical protein
VTRIAVALVALAALASVAAAPLARPGRGAQTPAVGCADPESRQFDFWLGDWDAVAAGQSTPSARVRVTRMLDGCAIREEYQDERGLVGESLSTFDRSRLRWHQSWVTNRGQLLLLEGEFRTGAMVLAGADLEAGPAGLARGTWTATPDGVREVGVTSPDGGQSWRPWLDLTFRPHGGARKPPAEPPGRWPNPHVAPR